MESYEPKFINITTENILSEHLSCIIRSRKPHEGVEAKRKWLSERLCDGHVFRKLDVKAPAFIEYAPLEKAWVPVVGKNYFYIYCLWTEGKDVKGKGYGKSLMEYCIADAKQRGKSGICLLGSTRQKHWLTSQGFAQKFGFEVVDSTDSGYQLFALSFDGTKPEFTENAKKGKIDNKELTIYYDYQCPFILQNIDSVKDYCTQNKIPLTLIQIDSLEKAKNIPCPFNNYAVFYNGEFKTVNLLMDLNEINKL